MLCYFNVIFLFLITENCTKLSSCQLLTEIWKKNYCHNVESFVQGSSIKRHQSLRL